MKEDKIYNKKRADRKKKLKECYPNITSKPLRLLAELICILRLQKLVSIIQPFFIGISYILIIVFIIIFLPKLISFNFDSLNSSIEKEKKEILEMKLTTPSQKKWLENVNEFTIWITDKTCTTFKLNKDYLETKRGFHSIKFETNKYSLKFRELENEKALLNGLDKTLNETCKMYSVDDLWIFAKSYADKSDNPSKKYFLETNYLYNKIDYYKLSEMNSTNSMKKIYWIDNINLDSLYLTNNKFTNNDLIYLRSNFVGEEIFKKFLDFTYIDVKNKQFGILEGDILDEKDEEYRRTDIYITFCKDNK